MRRSRIVVFAGIATAMGVLGVGAWRIPLPGVLKGGTIPHVEGMNEQQGWAVVRGFDGIREQSDTENEIFHDIQTRLHFSLGRTTYTPHYIGLELQTPPDVDLREANGKFMECSLFARIPGGRAIPLDAQAVTALDGGNGHRVLCRLPQAPGSCKYMEVFVQRSKVVEATWHVDNFPRLTHSDLGRETVRSITPFPSATLTAEASWDANTSSSELDASLLPLTGRLHFHYRKSAPSDADPWTLDWTMESEWTEPEYCNDHNQERSDYGFGLNDSASVDANSSVTIDVPSFSNVPQLVGISGTLEKIAERTELVTFHNVPIKKSKDGSCFVLRGSGLTKRSLNGVTVHLLPETSGPDLDVPKASDKQSEWATAFSFTFSPEGSTLSIPSSSLKQSRSRPSDVQASLEVVGNDVARQYCVYTNAPILYEGAYLRKPPGSRMHDDVVVTLTEKVIAQTIPFSFPFSFTVPVSPAK